MLDPHTLELLIDKILRSIRTQSETVTDTVTKTLPLSYSSDAVRIGQSISLIQGELEQAQVLVGNLLGSLEALKKAQIEGRELSAKELQTIHEGLNGGQNISLPGTSSNQSLES